MKEQLKKSILIIGTIAFLLAMVSVQTNAQSIREKTSNHISKITKTFKFKEPGQG